MGDLICRATDDGQTRCTYNGRAAGGLAPGPCVDLSTRTWVAPGEPLDRQPVQISRSYKDPSTGQSWAILVTGETVPACFGRPVR